MPPKKKTKQKKAVIQEEGNKSVNWKQLIVDTHGKVAGYEERFNGIHREQKGCRNEAAETRKELKEHCVGEEKDKQELKDHICRKMAEGFKNFKCPDEVAIAEIKLNGVNKENKIEMLGSSVDGYKDTVTGYKKSVDDLVTEIKDEKAKKTGELRVWKKIGKWVGGVAIFLIVVTPIITYLLGLWGF